MASKYKGYMGKILDVDLTTGKIGTYDLSTGTGSALSARSSHEDPLGRAETVRGPLSPENS
jgi:hypothetical protein